MGVLVKGGGWDLGIDPRQVLFQVLFSSIHLALPQAHKVSAHSQSRLVAEMRPREGQQLVQSHTAASSRGRVKPKRSGS